MLAGLEEASGNDSESEARKAALGNASRGDAMRPVAFTPT
jgi:hypothetical protein